MSAPRLTSATFLALLASSVAAAAMDLSTSVVRPTPIDPASGVVSGNLPGSEGTKSYYIALDLLVGDLVTQLEVVGPKNTAKRVEFELLDAGARVAESAYVMAEADAKNTTTKTYPIDRSGNRIVRLNVTAKKPAGSVCFSVARLCRPQPPRLAPGPLPRW